MRLLHQLRIIDASAFHYVVHTGPCSGKTPVSVTSTPSWNGILALSDVSPRMLGFKLTMVPRASGSSSSPSSHAPTCSSTPVLPIRDDEEEDDDGPRAPFELRTAALTTFATLDCSVFATFMLPLPAFDCLPPLVFAFLVLLSSVSALSLSLWI